MKKMKNTSRKLAILLALAMTACGYGFRHQQSNLPPEIKTIAIPMFENKTNEVRLEALVTEQVRYQFSQSQILRLVSEDQADVILRGQIISVSSGDVSLTESTRSQVRRVSVGISVKLVRKDNNEILYDGRARQWRTYTVSANDVTSTQTARNEALRLVVRDAAQIIHDGALQNF